MKKCSVCKSVLDENWFCEKCDANTCDVCGRVSLKVKAGRWIFYCSDNPKCKEKELEHISGEMNYALETGEMPDYEILENYI